MSNHHWIMMSLYLIGLTACGGGGSSSPSTPVSSAISTNEYLPAQNGATWTYSDDSTGQSYQVTSSPVTVHTDGSETFSLNWPHSGFKQFFEYKDQRLYLDGLTFNQVMVNGTRYSAQFDLSTAPFLLLPPYAELGARTDAGYSDVTTTITPNPGPAYATVLSSWKNHGIETLVTQHGSYEAIHIEFTLGFDVTVYSPTYEAIDLNQIPLRQELWFTPSIGIIKIKDTSASVTNPTELSLDGFNRFRDQDGEVTATLPATIEIDEQSPWKDLHSAFGIDAFYGTWQETANTCSPAPTDDARYQLTLSKQSYTLTKVTYQNGDCGVNGKNVFKTESVKTGGYKFISDGEPSDSISLKLSVQSETLRDQFSDSPWGSYYDGTSGVEEIITLKKSTDNQLQFEIYDWGSLHNHTLNYIP